MVLYVLSLGIAVGVSLDVYWEMLAAMAALFLGACAYITFAFDQQPNAAVFKCPLVPLLPGPKSVFC